MKRFCIILSALLFCMLLVSNAFAEDPELLDLVVDPELTEETFNDETDDEFPFKDETDEELPFNDETDEEFPFYDEADDDWEYDDGDDGFWLEEAAETEDAFDPEAPDAESFSSVESLPPMPNADPGNSVFVRELSAEEAANARVTVGADLTRAQRRAVYEDFGIAEGSVSELVVTNVEERAYLSGLVSEKQIGRVSLSCAYIQKLPEGSGLTINLHNVNYITADIYRNALITAGVKDADVVITAPYPVSGTGALVGIYKAYEDLTGSVISEQLKQLSAEELVVTSELSEEIGRMEAADLIAQLKLILGETRNMSDEAVRTRIKSLADACGVNLKKKQVNRILKLVRKLEDMDDAQVSEELAGLVETAQKASGVAGFVGDAFGDVKDFCGSVGSFVDELF